MSLARLAMRVAAARALRGVTLAEARVYDSAIAPIDQTIAEERQPILIVTTDDHEMEVTGRDLFHGNVSCDLVIEAAIAARVEVPGDNGGESVITIPHTDEGILGTKPTRALHLDTPPTARAFLVDDFGVAQRMIRIPRDASYSYRLGRETWTTTYPKADLVDVRPQSVAEQHPAQTTALYAARRQFILGKHLPPTVSWRYIYERWHIHDPDRVPDVRIRSTHLGFTRLGMPPYHAEVRTRIKGRLAPRTAGPFVNGYLMTGNRKPIADVREAIRVSKSLRDRILLDTRTWRFPRAGDRLKVGTVTLGRFIAA